MNEECFTAWAPESTHWSRWAKPVLFANLDRALAAPAPGSSAEREAAAPDVSWLPDPRDRTLLIVELPGEESVRVGAALARLGYRPVPLFNGCVGPGAVLDQEPIARALLAAAEELRRSRIDPAAPPAFLLDARRMKPAQPPAPGRFDNRWIVLPQDFPSSSYLRARGINEAMLIRDEWGAAQDDLSHVLLRWREGGMRLYAANVREPGRPRDLDVRAPSGFRRAWYRVMALAGLRRGDAGGFGAVIPIVTASAG